MTIARRRAAVGVFAGVLTLAACLPSLEQVSPDDSVPWPGGGGISATSDPNGSAVYSQDVVWSSCGSLECATIQVPLDWSDPSGQTLSLAINRSQARVSEERLGSLLFNPGGPGGSGLDLVLDFINTAGDRLLDHYDIVGFDPRGVGQSYPVTCGTDAELDAYFLADDIISTEAELGVARQRNTDFAERCRELTGPLIENVDTVSAARDMDVIRAVVGDEKLNLFGVSYGTQLGATYAALYPENVGYLVLDGAVDMFLSPEEHSLGQAKGFEDALMAYIADCLTDNDCPLPRDPSLARRTIADLLVEARDEGIPADGEDLNGTYLFYGIIAPLYNETAWPILSDALRETLERGTGRYFQYIADVAYLDRDENGHYVSNGNEAYVAISCLDTPVEPFMPIAEFRDFQRKAEEVSPTFGWWFGSGAGCEGWPWTANEVIDDLSPTKDAAPIVVIGTTGDPATPYEWAQSLVEQMPTATLVTYKGEGHGAYGRSNSCIVDAIDAFFVDGTVPASGLTC